MSRRNPSGNPSIQLSKALSWLLRHGAEKEGFQFLPGGYLYVDSILEKSKFSKYAPEDILSVVTSNDKQRFHVETDADTGRLKIRANQGHSIEVPDLELEAITSAEELPLVIHGTYYRFWESIRKQGLKRMRRTHVHFAAGEPGSSGVISGMRGSCDVMIYLDLEKALAGGLKFFRSANNVILSEGNEEGVIAPEFFLKVVDRRTGREVEIKDSPLVSSGDGQEKSDLSLPVTAASPGAVSAEDLADEMDNQKKQRRKKGKFKEKVVS